MLAKVLLLGIAFSCANADFHMRLVHSNGKYCDVSANIGEHHSMNCPYRSTLSGVQMSYNKDVYCTESVEVVHGDLRSGTKWFARLWGICFIDSFLAGMRRVTRNANTETSIRTLRARPTGRTTSRPRICAERASTESIGSRSRITTSATTATTRSFRRALTTESLRVSRRYFRRQPMWW